VVRGLRFLFVALTLFGVWLLLSGKFDALHAGAGTVAALAIAAASFPWKRREKPLPLLRLLAFLPWELRQIVQSNLHVARVVLSPSLPVSPLLIRRAPRAQSGRALTLLGCAITLTPGTLTIDMGEDQMIVHALDDTSAAGVEQDTMEAAARAVFEEQPS
jgi:multicomponent Na+:H+ antiporter subunit E